MNLNVLLIIGLFGTLINSSEVPCTLYLYPSKPDPENLYDVTRSFILPFGRGRPSHGVQLPLREGYDDFYTTQYYEKPINSVKYIVTQGNQCDICWIVGGARGYRNIIVDPLTPGEIYTFDRCLNYVQLGCDYYYPPYE